MSKGWISLHREIKDHWLYQEKRQFSKLEAWLDILLNVNHADKKVMIKNSLFLVKRGDSINSLDTWAKRWNWNKSRVRRFLSLLENESMICIFNETKTTRLTVCNYDNYQDLRNADETQMKRKRNASETLATPNNNDNNDNNVNNNKTLSITAKKNSPQSLDIKNGAHIEKALPHFINLFDGKKTQPKTKAEIKKWFDCLVKMEKQGYEITEVYKAVKWAVKDNFWSQNTLSILPLLTKRNGVRKLDNILSRYNAENKTSNIPAEMLLFKNTEWRIVKSANGEQEIQATQQNGTIVNQWILSQNEKIGQTGVKRIFEYLSKQK